MKERQKLSLMALCLMFIGSMLLASAVIQIIQMLK